MGLNICFLGLFLQSLCNAYVGLRKGTTERKREITDTDATSSTSTTTNDTNYAFATIKNDTNDGRQRGLSKGLKVRLMALGKEVLLVFY